MSRTELRAFLAGVEWVALGTLDEKGGPAGDVAPAAASGETLFFAVAPGSAAEANLSRDPRCCVAADAFPSYYEIKGATVHGAAMRVQPESSVIAALAVRAKAHGLSDGIVYALPLFEDSFGFDFGKLARR